MGIKNKGFTLAELLVVMVIILIVACLVYPTVIRAIKSGESAQCISQSRQIGIALELYLQDYGRYPDGRRYAFYGEDRDITVFLADYIEDGMVYICPSTEEPFKEEGLSYIYNNSPNPEWLLVDARLPESPNPHMGDRATVLWSDGHATLEEVLLPE